MLRNMPSTHTFHPTRRRLHIARDARPALAREAAPAYAADDGDDRSAPDLRDSVRDLSRGAQ
jgi:hypothetical protein